MSAFTLGGYRPQPGSPTSCGPPDGGRLRSVVDQAVEVVGGVVAASVSVLSRDRSRLETAAASSELARRFDEIQSQVGSGPSLEAVLKGTEVVMAVRFSEDHDAPAATDVRHVWAFPLRESAEASGALNLYCAHVAEVQAHTARALAAHAVTALLLERAVTDNDQLHHALTTRTVISQAQGMLMARQGITDDEAFDVLRRASQRANRKLRDIAADLIAANSHDDARSRQRRCPGSGSG